ncbi:MAG: ABC transporter permease [Anaerolineae bacterium]|nr:ABC transporter permease [Anaerolineae bacterium]
MTKYILRRLIQAIPTIFGITLIAYLVMDLAPGSPATQLFLDPELNQRQRMAMIEALGLNDPVYVKYTRWLLGDQPITLLGVTVWPGRELPMFDRRGVQIGTRPGESLGVIRGDFGKSIVSKQDVMTIIGNHIGATLELGWLSLLVGLLVGIPVGVLAAVWQGSLFDQITRVTSVIVSSIPVFWLGIVLLLIFGSILQWLPMGGRFPTTITGEYTAWERISRLILPTFTLASFTIATYSRFMRASLLDVLNQDYIRTAYSKGLSNRKVWFGHALRNALIPIATLLGPSLTLVITGAVLTETIYSWPGMGRLLVNSVNQQDYPIIMAVVILVAIATVIGYIISDILYAVFDPRVRLS